MFTVFQTLQGISKSQWISDSTSDAVLAKTITRLTAISTVYVDEITDIALSTSSNRALATSYVLVNYTLEYIEDEDYYTDRYSSITETLSRAISTGNFTSVLQATADDFNCVYLETASTTTGSIHVTAPVMVSSSSSDKGGRKSGALANLSVPYKIGALIAILLIISIPFCAWCRKRVVKSQQLNEITKIEDDHSSDDFDYTDVTTVPKQQLGRVPSLITFVSNPLQTIKVESGLPPPLPPVIKRPDGNNKVDLVADTFADEVASGAPPPIRARGKMKKLMTRLSIFSNNVMGSSKQTRIDTSNEAHDRSLDL